MPGLVRLAVGESDDVVGLLPDFAGAEEEADCLFQLEVRLLTLAFPTTSVTSQSIDLELLEHLG